MFCCHVLAILIIVAPFWVYSLYFQMIHSAKAEEKYKKFPIKIFLDCMFKFTVNISYMFYNKKNILSTFFESTFRNGYLFGQYLETLHVWPNFGLFFISYLSELNRYLVFFMYSISDFLVWSLPSKRENFLH